MEVPESQVLNLAQVNLAKGHEVLHEVVSTEAAYFVEADLEVAYPHHLQEELLLEQVCIVLVEVSAPMSVAVPVAGHQALVWLNLSW